MKQELTNEQILEMQRELDQAYAWADANDAWIAAMPEDPYELCPCGCGKKFRFAIKEGIDAHMKAFVEQYKTRKTYGND